MLDAILKLFPIQLHLAVALPLAVIVAGLALSLTGKSKAFFDRTLTLSNFSASAPNLLAGLSVAHACLGVTAAYWCYFYTDLFSPSVDQALTHPLGRAFMRRSDWSLIGTEALLYLPLPILFLPPFARANHAAAVFIFAIVPTALFVAVIALIYPTLITHVALTPFTSTGFLWWYSEVVLLGFPTGLALLAAWFLLKFIRSQ
jgi:hypothetical protein